ncbi:bifunctional riboflavin kinase/FAD synthetase [Corynebacterium liangguodongii]|uniref:Riboflavin biosynthesis protein n=1 Tax=Corynebacterium liangguodongii TaxID=2079535 RepID=A0A2S0WEK4_9CORY|nr:bifunctional riboflavin kinase/FAD synthetase [Corynebacterium liangguodongii]AWB84217.1 bifunctional riboflavin kinase/FAD synthetase [Corynebacterium liangguodongii]PWC00227.1 bifunctional riboflavin kinase/FAD synthetase [Corynebacterium liangguodongii]
MDILRGLEDVPASLAEGGGCVVTIGVFDGVHRGHQLLIGEAVGRARRAGLPSVVMTFEPHPVAIFAPDRAPKALIPLEGRAEVIAGLGVDYLLVIDLREELVGLSPRSYATEVLLGALGARTVVVGENFTFGKDAAGTARTMVELGDELGFEVVVVPLLCDGSERVCSTAVRDDLARGDVTGASKRLGRSFSVTAPIERGAGRGGRELGYPTANQYVADISALPGDGVYAGWLTIVDGDERGPLDGNMEPGVRYPAAISVGTNPTFGDARRSVESFVLDAEADLYDRLARVEFVGKVRDMTKFDSVDELLDHMARDVDATRTLLRKARNQ